MENLIRIPVNFLKIGMFVGKLDRSWLDTPYPLEGIWICKPEDIEELHMYCDEVYVDPIKSCDKFPNLRVFFSNRRKFKSKNLETKSLADISTNLELPSPIEDVIDSARVIYTETSSLYLTLYEDVKKDQPPDIDDCTTAVSTMLASLQTNPDALVWLSVLKNKAHYAYQHSINVAIHMLQFGRQLKLPENQLLQLGLVGLLQDIGKASLPENVIKKEQQLTPDELKLVRLHVGYSIKLLEKDKNLDKTVLNAIREHHERFNGSGYPKGLKGKQISRLGAMAAITDSYDAILSDRPGGLARSPYDAIKILHENKGVLYHAALVERFIQCVGVYAPGSIVELNTGEVGIVIEQNQIRRLKPKLLVILSSDKTVFAEPFIIDLLLEPVAETGLAYQIQTVADPGKYHIDPADYYI